MPESRQEWPLFRLLSVYQTWIAKNKNRVKKLAGTPSEGLGVVESGITSIFVSKGSIPLSPGSIGSAGSGPRYPAEVLWNEAVTVAPAGTVMTASETGCSKPVLQMMSFEVMSVTG